MHSKTLMKAFMMTAAAMLVMGTSQQVVATPLMAGAATAPEALSPVESVHYYGYGRGYYGGYGRGYYGGYYGRGYYGYGRGYYGGYGRGYYGYGRGYYGGYRYY